MNLGVKKIKQIMWNNLIFLQRILNKFKLFYNNNKINNLNRNNKDKARNNKAKKYNVIGII